MSTNLARLLGAIVGASTAAALWATDLPPLADTTPTHEHFPGKFVWADLFTPDPSAAQAFYTGLFGWGAVTIERSTASGTHSYIVLTNDGEPVAGIGHRQSKVADAWRGRWVGYVSVPDVAKALTAATSGGGRVLFPAKSLPQRGVQAMIVDPEGAEIGLLHSSAGDPGDYATDPGDLTWAQLSARDPAGEGRFYLAVVGWDVLPDSRGDRQNVSIFASGGYSRASVVPWSARPNVRPGWLLFIRVADVKASVAKAVSLGGRLLVPPGDSPAEYWRAVVADPTGAAIGLVQLQNPDKPKEPQ